MSLYLKNATPHTIMNARRRITNHLTSIMSRARRHGDRGYKMHTATGLTLDYNVVVTGVIVIDEEV
jgi:hypothetical protein